MPKSLSIDEAFLKCNEEGMFIPQQEIDTEKIMSMLEISEEDSKALQDLIKAKRWNALYKIAYDVLHTLCEALLLTDKIKSQNHHCLFAYVCKNHPELELNWGFFEKVRTKRNGIHYYGTSVKQPDWKEVELQIRLYTKAIRQAIEEKSG